MREDGRRCLDEDEMRKRGWTLNETGRWHDPEHDAAVRERFEKRANLAEATS
jgi:hypothetical protein